MRKVLAPMIVGSVFVLSGCLSDDRPERQTCLNYLTTGEQQQILCPPGFHSGDGIYLKDGKWTSV